MALCLDYILFKISAPLCLLQITDRSHSSLERRGALQYAQYLCTYIILAN